MTPLATPMFRGLTVSPYSALSSLKMGHRHTQHSAAAAAVTYPAKSSACVARNYIHASSHTQENL